MTALLIALLINSMFSFFKVRLRSEPSFQEFIYFITPAPDNTHTHSHTHERLSLKIHVYYLSSASLLFDLDVMLKFQKSDLCETGKPFRNIIESPKFKTSGKHKTFSYSFPCCHSISLKIPADLLLLFYEESVLVWSR